MQASKARLTAERILDGHYRQHLDGPRQEQVLDFHEFYGAPVGTLIDNEASHMSDERLGLRLGLIIEECKELLEDGFGIYTDINYRNVERPTERDVGGLVVTSDIVRAVKSTTVRNVVGMADALGDISYVVDGMAIELGFDLDAVINEIHSSNMTKPDAEGKPIYREDGKVLKGPNYVKPDIEGILRVR